VNSASPARRFDDLVIGCDLFCATHNFRLTERVRPPISAVLQCSISFSAGCDSANAMDGARRTDRADSKEISAMASKKTAETPMTAPSQASIDMSETTTTALAAVKNGFDQSVGALKDHAAGAMAGFEKTHTEVKANMDKVMKSAEEMVSFGQGNVEAIVKSSQIWAAGVQDLSKAFAATAQAQMDAAMAAMKALSAVKSLKDAVELHSTTTRNSVETVMAETGKLTDASMKLAEQAMAPLAARVTLAAEKFGRAA
jgi:phasin family protein